MCIIIWNYPLSHTVVNKKKIKEEKKNNKNIISRSVTNGKQYKHQNTLSYSSHFMVKRPVSWINFELARIFFFFFHRWEFHCQICCWIFIVLSHWITRITVRGYICRFIRTYYLDSEPTSLCVYPLMLRAKRKNNKYQFV